MQRRDFLSTIALASAAMSSSLFAKDQYLPKDALIMNKEFSSLVNDVYLDSKYHEGFYGVRNKLKLIQRHVGYGNFNIISFDEVLNVPKWTSRIEAFTEKEVEFIEFIFNNDPKSHGFYGLKTVDSLTQTIDERELIKIPRSGHYLFKGKTLETYYHMKKDIGSTLVLTSGVRSVVKQMKLFLDKLYASKLNLSEASKSLAPPAYSYHTIGDFDIGKKGLGYDNFTARFALTEEFTQIRKLKYIDMRYTINNKDGVRYEPWHIKII